VCRGFAPRRDGTLAGARGSFFPATLMRDLRVEAADSPEFPWNPITDALMV